MDVADHLRLRQREQVAIVEQVLLGIFEALAADIRFLHPVRADGGAHGSIDDGNTAFKNRLQWMFVGGLHGFSWAPGCGYYATLAT